MSFLCRICTQNGIAYITSSPSTINIFLFIFLATANCMGLQWHIYLITPVSCWPAQGTRVSAADAAFSLQDWRSGRDSNPRINGFADRAISRSGTRPYLVPRDGFEPPTPSSSGQRSTPELSRQMYCSQQDLIPTYSRIKAGELILVHASKLGRAQGNRTPLTGVKGQCPNRQTNAPYLVNHAGIEPATYRLRGGRSNHLS